MKFITMALITSIMAFGSAACASDTAKAVLPVAENYTMPTTTSATSTQTEPVASSGPKIKEVCKDKVDKAGKVVVGKDKKAIQVCKKIKVHKKLEGTKVTDVKKK